MDDEVQEGFVDVLRESETHYRLTIKRNGKVDSWLFDTCPEDWPPEFWRMLIWSPENRTTHTLH